MTKLKALYYYPTGNHLQYTDKVTTQLDLNRAFRKLKPWVLPKRASSAKQKTLILGDDWTSCNWSYTKIDQVTRKLEQLLDEGFAIYINQSNRFEPVLKENLKSLSFGMNFGYQDDIVRRAVKDLPLTKDAIFVVEDYDYWLSLLLDNHEGSSPRCLKVSDVLAFIMAGKQLPNLVAFIKQSLPIVSVIIQDDFSELGFGLANKLLTTDFPNATLLIKPRKLTPPQSGIDALLNNQSYFLSTIAIDNDEEEYYEFKVAQLNDVESLSLSNIELKKGQFEKLLQKIVGVKELNIQTSIECTNLAFLQEKLAKLEKLKIDVLQFTSYFDSLGSPPNPTVSAVTPETLRTLLQAASQLRSLYLQGTPLDGNLGCSEGNLSLLEEIQIHSSLMTTNNLNALLLATNLLKKMHLASCQILDGNLVLPEEHLKILSELTLKHTLISMLDLKTLLLAASNIETLSLHGYRNTEDKLCIPTGSLKKIYRLDLRLCQMATMSLQSLLGAASHVEQLDLSYLVLTGEALALPEGSLKEMIVLKMESTNLATGDLEALLLATSQLEELDLTFCINTGIITSIPEKVLSTLKNLNLSRSFVTVGDLQEWLTKAKMLKKLELSSCTKINGKLVLPQGSLQELSKLNLSESSLTTEGLNAFLAAATNLWKLNVMHCKNLSAGLAVQPRSLTSINCINATGSSMTGEDLQVLLEATTTLKYLYITGCTNIGSSFEIPERVIGKMQGMKLDVLPGARKDYLENLLSAATAMKSLKLYACENLDITEIAEGGLDKLEWLILGGEEIMADSLQTLLLSASQLMSLDLKTCKKIRGSLTMPESSLKNLKTLGLDMTSMTEDDLTLFLAAASNLTCLNLTGCSQMDSDLIASLKEERPGLQVQVSWQDNEFFDRSNTGNPAPMNQTPVDDPKHHSQEWKKSKPKPPGSFKYEGQNPLYNQTMLIQQFSQYLTLCAPHLGIIDTIQDGICSVLGIYLLREGYEALRALLQTAHDWDGNEESITPLLVSTFGTLLSYIQEYSAPHILSYYLGDNLRQFLANNVDPCLLSNTRHLVLLWPLPLGGYLYYDSNAAFGPKICGQNLDVLLGMVEHSLGSLVSIQVIPDISPFQPQVLPLPLINHPQFFLQEGGLLTLMQSSSAEWMLSQIPHNMDWSIDSLEGLFLRDKRAVPAWMLGMQHPSPDIARFCDKLLSQYILKNPHHKNALRESMEAMDAAEKKRYIGKICVSFPDKFHLLTALLPKEKNSQVQAYKKPSRIKYFEGLLQTWDTTPTQEENAKRYSFQCVQSLEIKKRLIKLDSSTALKGMRFALSQAAKALQLQLPIPIPVPVFYVSSPEDLVCNAPFIHRLNQDTGRIQDGEAGGGALYDFLTANQHNASIITINYDNFDAEDIIHAHEVLETVGTIDKTKLPPKAMIIGLININKPDCYQGSDFYGRFDKQESCPVSQNELTQYIPGLPLCAQMRNPGNAINLFHAEFWKDLLLGKWVPEGDIMRFEEGALSVALEKNNVIEIQNGFWDQEPFRLFWQEAIANGKIEHAGRIIKIPANLRLLPHEGYEWVQLCAQVTHDPDAALPLVLNPSRFNHFFRHLDLDNQSNAFQSKLGFIEEQQGKTLNVFLTHSIFVDEWAMLLTECKKYGVLMNISRPPTVTLPSELGNVPPIPVIRSIWQKTVENPTQVIHSTDMDTTEAMLKKGGDWQGVDVSEFSPFDLIERFDGEFNQKTLRFEYQRSPCILNALSQGRHIILKGRFSPELVEQLAPILLERQRLAPNVQGKLVLITDNVESFQFLPKDVLSHEVTVANKEACLGMLSDRLQKNILPYMHEPLRKIKARLAFWRHNPLDVSSDFHWLGLESLPDIPTLQPFNPEGSASRALAFKERRRNVINAMLAHEPYVFIAGHSGVGKTTFVTQELCQEPDVLYHYDKFEDWLENKNPLGHKILFIDEATIDSGDWTIFEGLFQTPQSILYKGQPCPLSDGHKVVFAGNPVSYGAGRKLAKFFSDHGNTKIFSPLPTEVLYEDVLKPIFAGTGLECYQEELSSIFLEVYQFLVSCTVHEVPISPRELQMMALLTVSHCKHHPDDNPSAIARHFAFTLAENLVPTGFQDAFDNEFRPKFLARRQPLDCKSETFCMTSSRLPIYQYLKDILELRKDRISHLLTDNEDKLYGGLGGLMLEGEPGIGKTELLVQTLVDCGYEEMHDFNKAATSLHPFYRIPLNLNQTKKEALLRKAFDEGAVVIMDELNSLPPMETLINELLTGWMDGRRPNQPGFTIISSQNPVNMAGRHVQSTAFSRRIATFQLKPYTDNEMLNILLNKGLCKDDADSLIEAYNNQLNTAQDKHLSPLPTFRNVIHIAENLIKGRDPHENSLTQPRPSMLLSLGRSDSDPLLSNSALNLEDFDSCLDFFNDEIKFAPSVSGAGFESCNAMEKQNLGKKDTVTKTALAFFPPGEEPVSANTEPGKVLASKKTRRGFLGDEADEDDAHDANKCQRKDEEVNDHGFL